MSNYQGKISEAPSKHEKLEKYVAKKAALKRVPKWVILWVVPSNCQINWGSCQADMRPKKTLTVEFSM